MHQDAKLQKHIRKTCLDAVAGTQVFALLNILLCSDTVVLLHTSFT
jgi:hypothetical protein